MNLHDRFEQLKDVIDYNEQLDYAELIYQINDNMDICAMLTFARPENKTTDKS